MSRISFFLHVNEAAKNSPNISETANRCTAQQGTRRALNHKTPPQRPHTTKKKTNDQERESEQGMNFIIPPNNILQKIHASTRDKARWGKKKKRKKKTRQCTKREHEARPQMRAHQQAPLTSFVLDTETRKSLFDQRFDGVCRFRLRYIGWPGAHQCHRHSIDCSAIFEFFLSSFF
jgi:hypothetical protein